jgi:predicted acyl esterase
MKSRALPLTALLLTAAFAVPSSAATPRASGQPTPGRSDSTWSEAYFPSADGITTLHADILRPKGLSDSARMPVVMTVSPYTGHGFDSQTATGPNHRFYDFLDQSRILSRGYTYVIVDLPGFGGSGGCNDWGGPVEQGGVKSAVEWAAAQPWSTGKVGLFGKSYDGWTGLMGIAQHPKGLAAVLSMEPVYSGYRYLYSDGVRFVNSVSTPALFQAYDVTTSSVNDTPQYQVSAAPEAYCYAPNYAQQAGLDDPTTDFWKARDLLPSAKKASTPLFLTQGFLEDNTKPDGAFTYLRDYAGPKHAWLGQHEHVRGYDATNGVRANGRTQFIAEANRFLDHWLKGAAATGDPAVEVQDGDGHWRGEKAWPPADSKGFRTNLATGGFADDGNNNGSGGGTEGVGIWSISQPLRRTAHYAGEAVVRATVNAPAPRANLVANTYDIAPDGKAVLLGRAATLLRGTGVQTARLTLYGQDWVMPAGHRVGLLLSSSNAEWYVHAPTQQTVSVTAASVLLPFLTAPRHTFFADGVSTPRLRAWRAGVGTITVSGATIAAAQRTFTLP